MFKIQFQKESTLMLRKYRSSSNLLVTKNFLQMNIVSFNIYASFHLALVYDKLYRYTYVKKKVI